MLSLSPRYDLYRFMLPDGFLPKEVEDKYYAKISKERTLFTSALDYLNESIVSIDLPGIDDINIEQGQTSINGIVTRNDTSAHPGRINREPNHPNTYIGTANPLEKIGHELTVNFRKNQGALNYYMILETIFYRICKPLEYKDNDDFKIYFLDESGTAIAYIHLLQCHIDGLDGVQLDFTKVDRQSDTFQVKFKFNNINYEFITEEVK